MASEYIPPRLYDAGGDLARQWFVYYSVAVPGSKVKRRVKVYDNLNSFTTKRERRERAKVLIQALMELLGKGWRPGTHAPGGLLLDALAAAIERRKPGFRPRTVTSYTGLVSMIRHYLDSLSRAEMLVSEWSPADVRGFVDWLVKVRGVKGRTVNGYAANGRILWNYLLQDKLIEENPWREFKPFRTDKKSQYVAFTKDETQRLTAYMAAHAPNLGLLCRVIYYTGARPNEVINIRRRDIDAERARLTIPAAVSKNRRTMAVNVPAHFVPELLAHAGQCPADWYLFSRDFLPGEKLIWRNRVSEAFQRVRDACGIPPEKTLYSWKHTAAVMAYLGGATPLEIMRQFRHHSLDMTMVYLRDLGLEISENFSEKLPRL